MARIICISKYPPLEGGIASKTYWLCSALAEKGHAVHVVTDPQDIDAEYCSPVLDTENSEKNIHIHRPQEITPWHIPNDPHRDMALLNTALEVIDRYGADIIDTGYIIPYGLVGYMASQITGVPFILRHGGSDIKKFVDARIWDSLMMKAFNAAAIVITDEAHMQAFSELSKRVVSIPPYVPDPSFFRPEPLTEKKEKPVLALIGKANFYWRHKGWHRVVDIMKYLGNHFNYLIVSQGIGLKDFKKYAEDRLDCPIRWQEFIHPPEMPQMLRSVNGLFALQQDLPFPVFSNLILEALYCNVSVITDRHDTIQKFVEHKLHVDAESHKIIVIPENHPNKAAEEICKYFDSCLPNEIMKPHRELDYKAYIQKNEDVIGSAITAGS